MKKIEINHKPNQIRASLALAKISLLSSLRNPSSLFFSFFFPFIFIAVFGLISQGTAKFDIGVRSTSLQEGPLYEALKDTSVVHLVTDQTDDELTDQLKKGTIPAALTITKNGTILLPDGSDMSTYAVNLEESASDPQNAQTVATIVKNISDTINNPGGAASQKLIDLSELKVEGRKYSEIDFILPGQLAFALLSSAMIGIAMTFTSLRKELITKRIFASPVNKWTILVGEVIARLTIGILQALIIILVGHYLFNFTLAEGVVTLAEMVFLSIIGIFVFLSFGLFAASIAKTEDAISPITNLIMMPQLFLSGAFFSISAFPAFLQPIAQLLPMTFLNDALRMVAFQGTTLVEVWPKIAGLVVWGIVMYAIDIRLFKWEN